MSKFNKLEQRVDEAISGQIRVNKLTDDNINKIIDKVDTSLLRLVNQINYLNDSQKTLTEWVEALNFLSWFNWDKIYSNKLIKEAKNKLWHELDYPQATSHIPDKLDFDNITIKPKKDTEKYGQYTINSNFGVGKCEYSISPNITELKIDGRTVYLEDPRPKYEYRDYVKAVVATPHNFPKEVVYSVYKYLKDIINKDKLTKEYSN